MRCLIIIIIILPFTFGNNNNNILQFDMILNNGGSVVLAWHRNIFSEFSIIPKSN